MFKFYIKKCYCVAHVLVKRSKTFKNLIYLFSSLCEFRLTMVSFESRTSRSKSVDVNEQVTTTLTISTGNLERIPKKMFFPKLQKSEQILDFRKKMKFSFSEFRKIDLIILPNRSNRSNRKKSLNRLDRFIGQRININSCELGVFRF